ncbi:unnamed protein product [Schistosoma turkestanicum]|nr:unnamed protein product [Schistosoma turkestanicum]
MIMNLQCIPSQDNLLAVSESKELSKIKIPLGEQNFIQSCHSYPLAIPKNKSPFYVIYDDGVQSDCCTRSSDPLINGPARCDCLFATILATVSIILLLIGIVLTILHYVVGMEFYTVNRGQTVGPLLIGLTVIPFVFMIYFICTAKFKLVDYVEQMTMNYRIKERMAYRQHQAELARSSIGLRSSSRHS